MSHQAERVYTDEASIRRLESLVDQLPAEVNVVLVMQDGSSCDGVVTFQPDVCVFHDATAHRGLNARVRLRRPDAPEWLRMVWLDQVLRVERLDFLSAGDVSC